MGFLSVSFHASCAQLVRRRRSSLWLPKLFNLTLGIELGYNLTYVYPRSTDFEKVLIFRDSHGAPTDLIGENNDTHFITNITIIL